MKRAILILMLSTVGGLQGYAQTTGQIKRQAQGSGHNTQWIRDIFSTDEENKSTANAQRVVAESKYQWNGNNDEITDSVRYWYSGSNGSTFSYDLMLYNYFPSYGNDLRYLPHDPGRMNVKADSLYEWSVNQNTQVFEKFCNVYTALNSDNKAAEHLQNYFTSNQMDARDRYLYTYNSQGMATEVVLLTYTTQWDTFSKTKFYYNNLDKRLLDTIFSYPNGVAEPTTADTFIYDSNGDLIQVENAYFMNGNWYPSATYTISYYPGSGKLKDYTEAMSGFATKDSFAYDQSNSFPTHYWHYDLNTTTNSMDLVYRYSKHIGQNGLPDTMIHENMGQIVFTAKWVFEYNSTDNPVRMDEYYLDGSTFIKDRTFYYYYEDVNEPSKVEKVQRLSMEMYPNPTDDKLYIKLTTRKGQHLEVTVTDNIGRIISDRLVAPQTGIQSIDVSNLNAGTYWLKVQDEEGGIIVRQFIKK